MKSTLKCPDCNCENIVKNGYNASGKKKYRCNNCGRQFVENPEHRIIPESVKVMIEKLLLEKIPLAGIVRVVGVSKRWLQYYVNDKYENIPQVVNVTDKKKGKLTIECDEMWSFVGNKGYKVWIWLAKDIKTREIVGVYAGGTKSVLKVCGILFQVFTVNVLLHIQIFGLHTKKYFLRPGIAR